MKFSHKFLALSGAALLALSGCMDEDGTYDHTGTGALIGAGSGAALGTFAANMTNNCDNIDDEEERKDCERSANSTGAVIGTAMGTMVGTAIGYNMEKQEQDLRNDLAGSGAVITNTGDRLVVTLPEAITFPVDGTEVKSSLYGPLQSLATNINEYPGTMIQVVGHTDSTGSDSYNQSLSERRANAVATILRADGVPSTRLQTVGMGESAPIASNDTESGRQQNRRVEINIIPQS